VTYPRRKFCRRRMTNQGLLWVFDLAPGTIVTYDGDHGQVLAYHTLELHAVESEGTITVENQHLLARTSELGCHGKACACAKTTHWAWIEPVGGFVDVNDSPTVADDVTAIAYDCCLFVDEVAYLAAETHRMDRNGIRVHGSFISCQSLTLL